MIIYLYIKTHRITKLKYLGKTIKSDPHSYYGSGHYWKRHLKKYGYDYDTEILKECQSNDELKYWGRYYSELFNIIESEEWANLKIEEGDGGRPSDNGIERIRKSNLGRTPWNKGKKVMTEEQKENLRQRNLGKPSYKRTPETLEKFSKARKGKSVGKSRVSNRKGIIMSEEQKEKIRKSMLGQKRSEETKAKHRAIWDKRKQQVHS